MLQQGKFCLGIRRKSSDRKSSQTLEHVLPQGMWNLFPEELLRTSLGKALSSVI